MILIVSFVELNQCLYPFCFLDLEHTVATHEEIIYIYIYTLLNYCRGNLLHVIF